MRKAKVKVKAKAKMPVKKSKKHDVEKMVSRWMAEADKHAPDLLTDAYSEYWQEVVQEVVWQSDLEDLISEMGGIKR